MSEPTLTPSPTPAPPAPSTAQTLAKWLALFQEGAQLYLNLSGQPGVAVLEATAYQAAVQGVKDLMTQGGKTQADVDAFEDRLAAKHAQIQAPEAAPGAPISAPSDPGSTPGSDPASSGSGTA